MHRRWSNFTDYQRTPVTRRRQWPKFASDQNFTGDQKITGNFTGDQKITGNFTSDQKITRNFTCDQTSPVTKDHRWTSLVTKLHRWSNFTGDQISPVTKLHQLPNFTSDQSTPVTKLHRCPKRHRWQTVRLCTSLPPQHGIGVPHCLTEAESLALPGNKYYFDQGRPEALPNFCLWTLKLLPNMDETLGECPQRRYDQDGRILPQVASTAERNKDSL